MTCVIGCVRRIGYFSLMLLLTKKSIQLRVCCALTQVRITAIVRSPEEERLVSIIARNEELLAAFYLSIAGPQDQQQQQEKYFAHRGWQVEQV